MGRKKEIPITNEQHQANLVASDIQDMEYSLEKGILPLNPTRHFEIGQRVHWGAHKEVYIREIYKDGLYYKLESLNVIRTRGEDPHSEFHVLAWIDIFPWNQSAPTSLATEEKYRIRQSNSSIDSLMSHVYATHSGVDFDVDYQRDHVWTLEDKVALIDSIFNHIDIGKFVFVQREFKYGGKLREIIDGKQRLTAICEFYEDRFKYKGFYFSELSWRDKQAFESHGVTMGELEQPDQRGIYETFIKLNTCGRPMDHKHIDKVKELLKNLK